MKNTFIITIFLSIFGAPLFAQEALKKEVLSDAKIRKIIIKESIEAYDGKCPCPYNRTKRGHKCGKRSAYSRPGGEEPICYKRDVSKAMVRVFRERVLIPSLDCKRVDCFKFIRVWNRGSRPVSVP